MAIVTGTFTSAAPTTSSSPVFGTKVRVKMDFAGTASIDVEEQMHTGSWIKIVTGTTADYYSVFDAPTGATIRLTATAVTNDVVYSLETN